MQAITDLSELQNIELSIMKKVHEFCEENQICYFLAYGTLIGAIRHNGFIPWDDDIDIWMFREDFERFKDIFPSYGQERGLYLASKDSEHYYPRDFIKVCDARTTLSEPQYLNQDNFGVFVDIWPLDGTLKNPILKFFHNNCCYILRNLLYATVIKPDYVSGSFIKKMIVRCSKIFNYQTVLNYQEYFYKKISFYNSNTVECRSEKPSNLKKIAFSKRIKVNFEDAEFYVPEGFDSILKSIYGDWRKLPPEEEQVPHHIMNTYWK